MEFIVAAIFLWLLCSVIAGIAAGARGLNGCLWAMVGFVLGPFGVLLVLLWPSAQPVGVQRSLAVDDHPPSQAVQAGVEEGEQKLCPACRSYVPIAAVICRYCQTRFDPSEAPAPPPTNYSSGFCARCGFHSEALVSDGRMLVHQHDCTDAQQ